MLTLEPKPKKRKTTKNYIPEDILTSIFSWLTDEQVLQYFETLNSNIQLITHRHWARKILHLFPQLNESKEFHYQLLKRHSKTIYFPLVRKFENRAIAVRQTKCPFCSQKLKQTFEHQEISEDHYNNFQVIFCQKCDFKISFAIGNVCSECLQSGPINKICENCNETYCTDCAKIMDEQDYLEEWHLSSGCANSDRCGVTELCIKCVGDFCKQCAWSNPFCKDCTKEMICKCCGNGPLCEECMPLHERTLY